MKRATTPDLFADALPDTARPKLAPALPTTPAELAHAQAQLWETAPKHLLGIVCSQNCIYVDACWQPITSLTPAELIAAFSLQ